MAAGTILAELHTDDDYYILAKAVGEFANRELVPYLRRLGREEFPTRFIPLAANNGFVGSAIPAEYGGQSGTLEGLLSIVEGMAACDGSLALTLAAHESLAATHILLGGADAQKRKYLPELTAGSKIGAWCLTEPQAGSNIFHDTRTKLVRTADGWKLNGEKTFITNGCHAGLFVVLACTVGEDGRDAGMSACVVERRDSGESITQMPLHGKMGMNRSDTAALKFDDVPVADDAILGSVGSGGPVAHQVLSRGRIGVGALALGLARDSLQRAADYAKERKVAGGLLFDQPLTRAKISRMEGSLWVAWQAVRSAARRADHFRPFKVEACMAKVFATETAMRITDEAVQILGGYGYMRDYKVEQNYRDARLLTIGEGASEILRLAIARNLWGKNSADGDVLPAGESLAEALAPYPASMSDLWARSGRALQLASGVLHRVGKQIEQTGPRDDSASTWQYRAAGFADLATRVWVCFQAALAATRLLNRGTASPKHLKLVSTFLIDSSVEVCHQASDLLRTAGRKDANLLRDYDEALQIAAGVNSPSPVSPIVERP